MMTITNTIETVVFILGCSCVVAGRAISAEPSACYTERSILADTGIPTVVQPEQDCQLGVNIGWSSRYLTEGIDCLPGSSIWEIAPSIKYEGMIVSAWYAQGVSESYKELDLVLGYAWQIDGWTINPWYEHQFYLDQDYNVSNPALTISRTIDDWLEVGAEMQVKLEHKVGEAYYSVFCQTAWEVMEHVTVSPMLRYGYNGGYNPGVSDGSNCIDYSLGINWQYAESCSLKVSLNYSQAVSSLRRVGLGDVFWIGLQCGFRF